MPSWGQVLSLIQKQQAQGDDSPFRTVRHFYLSKLAEHTGRDTILYSTAWTEGGEAHSGLQIERSDIHGFMECVSGFEDTEELDLIMHSPGGSPEAAEQIVDYLRAKFDDFRIIVPEAAMSSASLMCCATDEIVMGLHSSLGPVDPQLPLQTGLGPRVIPAHAILDQFDLAREEYHKSGDTGPFEPMIHQYGPSLLAECEDAIELSHELAETWAREYMLKEDEDAASKASRLASMIADRAEFRSHGRPISRERADELGFRVSALEADQTFQDLVLSAFHATIHTHNSLGVIKVIENHHGNRYLLQPPQVEAPTGEDAESDDS